MPMKSWEEAWWALNMGLLSWPGREAQLPLRALSGLILNGACETSDGPER